MIGASERLWMDLWSVLGARGDAHATYDDLVSRYAEPHRSYHTLDHIRYCLAEFTRARHLARNPAAAEMALWYHDVVYDTHAKDNEEQSAKLAAVVLKNACVSGDLVAEVVRLILATKHVDIPVDQDAELVVDVDLSSLGLPQRAFDRNSRSIRKEYAWVPRAEFNRGRREFLESLQKRPHIYTTQFFRSRYEAQAQRNIARSIARLLV